MTTTAPARELEVWSEAQRLRVALIAPPAAAVPPSSLGGLDQVRWLAEGLAQRGHQVTLIGADLGILAGGGYAVVDSDPAGGHRASPQAAERWHAEQAGKVLEYLAGMDVEVVSDHTRTGWLPAGGASVDLPTVQTRYQPPMMRSQRSPTARGIWALSRCRSTSVTTGPTADPGGWG